MDVLVSKHCLVSALARTAGIADRKSSMQILSNVLIDARSAKEIRIAATDLNTSASGVLKGDVTLRGAVTVPAKTFYDVVKSMPDGPINVRAEGEAVQVSAGRAKFKLLGLPADDFPHIANVDGLKFYDMETSTLAAMIERTAFSISNDETRPHLNGALFQGDGKILRMVTTDGHRLSRVEFKIEESGYYNFAMVVPNKGIQELKRLVEDREGMVSVASHEGSLFARRDIEVEKGAEGEKPVSAEFVLTSKLIEAEFPPYEQVIPSKHERVVVAPRMGLLEGLRRVSVVSSERTLGVRFQFSEGQIEIVSDNPSVGQGTEVLDVAYNGAPVTIGFNARYFIDILSVLTDGEVEIELSGELDPAVVRDTSHSFVGVIMPMRI
ncbi:MAG: DNA polymerase III subunit beta [Deltaproteobacteria bacterium]|nr:DNA polymerase III subunit beta [Deltaproteobacteria bacterium]